MQPKQTNSSKQLDKANNRSKKSTTESDFAKPLNSKRSQAQQASKTKEVMGPKNLLEEEKEPN